MERASLSSVLGAAVCSLSLSLCCPAAAAEPVEVRTRYLEGTLRGYPVVRDRDGRAIGDGTVSQTVDAGGLLHVVYEAHYDDGVVSVERMTFRQKPAFVQLDWAVEERRGNEVQRKFSIDLTTGRAEGMRDAAARVDVRELEDTKGAFVGGGVAYAVKNLTARLDDGAALPLDVVAFTPTPRLVHVTVTSAGIEKLDVAGRRVDAMRYVIHPEVPGIAKLVIKAPDTILWLSHSNPPVLVRAETPRIEPSDPVIRIDLVGCR